MTSNKEVANDVRYEIISVPYLGQKSVPILHKDTFVLEKVQLSTFTMLDDILLIIDERPYIFSPNGLP